MNYKKLTARINEEVARLMAETPWVDGAVPAPFYFETKCVDLEIIFTALNPHPSFGLIHVFCSVCGRAVYFSDDEIGCINGNCAKGWSRSDIDTMGAVAIKKAFRTMEDTTQDSAQWPVALHDVEQDRKYVTSLQPMTREELVRARVTRFYAARQSFRKEFPCV